MQKIDRARLKRGVDLNAVAPPSAVDQSQKRTVVRGRALIFWDLKVLRPRKKLDA